jgi:hypothetical protein
MPSIAQLAALSLPPQTNPQPIEPSGPPGVESGGLPRYPNPTPPLASSSRGDASNALTSGPYRRVYVIDNFVVGKEGVAILATAKQRMVSHGDFVVTTLDVGINANKAPGDAGHVPIEAVPIEPGQEIEALAAILDAARSRGGGGYLHQPDEHQPSVSEPPAERATHRAAAH